MANTLGPADLRVGQVVDNEDESPWQAAALTFDETRGATLLVPYVAGEKQFARTERWFDRKTTPPSLVFVDDAGTVTLVGVSWRGHSGGRWVKGRLGAQVAIFNRPRKIKPEYKVKEFYSTIDGLEAFAGFRPVNFDIEPLGERQHRVSVIVEATESVTWRHDGFTFVIHADAAWTARDGSRFEVTDSSPYLLTSRSKGATPQDHLAAQRPIRALLVLLYGEKICWRSHKVRDDQFPMWIMSGAGEAPQAVETQIETTIEEHRAPTPEHGKLSFPAVTLRDLGTRGLRKWCGLYGNEDLHRAIGPAVEVLNGATRFVEPQLMMLAMALDRFGYFYFGDGRRRPMWEHIERCLDEAGLDWPGVGSRESIAKAIANLNNDLKHPDRTSYPQFTEIWCVNQLAKVVARAQVLSLLGTTEKVRDAFRVSLEAREAGAAFARNHVVVSNEGAVTRTT